MNGAITDGAGLTSSVAAECDAVIIGSGAGGAVLAKELAEGGMRVMVLEEGGEHRVHRGLAYESMGRMYRDRAMTTTMGRPYIPIPLGQCLGGTTLINSGTCFRTPPAVLRRWREERGLGAVHAEQLARCFDRVEAELPVAPAAFRVMSRPNTLVHELLERRGEHGAPLNRNAPECEGCGMCCYGCTSGAKRSMDQNYLPKAVQAGAALYTHARATRILRDGRGTACGAEALAIGEEGVPTGRALRVRAPIVAVACGAMLTPVLLKKNGIARGNPHLGRHLTIHPASKVAAEFNERIDCWDGIPQAYGYEGLHGEGIMFEGITMPPDLGPMGMPFSGPRLAHVIKHYRNIATFGFMISDSTEGRLVWRPLLGHMFKYTLSKTDVARVRKAVSFLARLFFEGGARRVYPMVTRGPREFQKLDDVDAFERMPLSPGDIEMMAFHPLGTCRIAASPEDGVCDAWHQVYGAPGLYVCDGSAVPTALGVNPQETIMALATRLAEHLLGAELPGHASASAAETG